MYRCKYCGKTKDRAQVYRSGHQRGVIKWACKDCERERRARRLATPEGRKAYDNSRRKYNAKNQKKQKARRAVIYAIKKGVITRPARCEFGCENVPIQAHHPDYSKPLDVRWLCTKHHAEAHHLPTIIPEGRPRRWHSPRSILIAARENPRRASKLAAEIGSLGARSLREKLGEDCFRAHMKSIRQKGIEKQRKKAA